MTYSSKKRRGAGPQESPLTPPVGNYNFVTLIGNPIRVTNGVTNELQSWIYPPWVGKI